MGDVAMTVPVLTALHTSNPELKMFLLTKKHFAPIFHQLPFVQVVEADVKGRHKGLFGLYRLFREVKKLDISAVADLHNVIRSKTLSSFFRLLRVSVVQLDKGRSEKRSLTKNTPKELKFLKTTHNRYVEVFKKLKFDIELGDFTSLPKKELPSIVKTSKGNNLIGVAPFASFQGKMYPLSLMKRTIAELLKNSFHQIFLFGGGANETLLLNGLEAEFGTNHVTNLSGKLSLKEELAFISNLDVMVSMDSGNGHLAANYGVPVVTVWGVTHPCLGFGPYNQPIENSLLANRDEFPLIPTSVYGNKLPEGYEDAIASIDPMAIAKKVQEILSGP